MCWGLVVHMICSAARARERGLCGLGVQGQRNDVWKSNMRQMSEQGKGRGGINTAMTCCSLHHQASKQTSLLHNDSIEQPTLQTLIPVHNTQCKPPVKRTFFYMAQLTSSLDIIEHPFSHAKRLFRLSPLAGKHRIHRLKPRTSVEPVISEPSLVAVFGDDRRRPRSSGTAYGG